MAEEFRWGSDTNEESLRLYLLELVEQGKLKDIKFRETGPAEGAAYRTVEIVQRALQARRDHRLHDEAVERTYQENIGYNGYNKWEA